MLETSALGLGDGLVAGLAGRCEVVVGSVGAEGRVLGLDDGRGATGGL